MGRGFLNIENMWYNTYVYILNVTKDLKSYAYWVH